MEIKQIDMSSEDEAKQIASKLCVLLGKSRVRHDEQMACRAAAGLDAIPFSAASILIQTALGGENEEQVMLRFRSEGLLPMARLIPHLSLVLGGKLDENKAFIKELKDLDVVFSRENDGSDMKMLDELLPKLDEESKAKLLAAVGGINFSEVFATHRYNVDNHIRVLSDDEMKRWPACKLRHVDPVILCTICSRLLDHVLPGHDPLAADLNDEQKDLVKRLLAPLNPLLFADDPHLCVDEEPAAAGAPEASAAAAVAAN